MKIKDFLIEMGRYPHVSGYESELTDYIKSVFSAYADTSVDKFGNLIIHKAGSGPKVMVCAHMDEIGMMVSAVCDRGFVKFSPIGGIDKRNMLAQEVTIHGRQKIYGIIGIKPPHLTTPKEANKPVEIYDMAIDTGFSDLNDVVKPGDLITLNQQVVELQNGRLSGRALDNTAGVAAMLAAMQYLKKYNHEADLYFVASAQEEVGLRGAKTAAFTIEPEIAIAVDVGFGRTAELSEHESIELGKGAAISIGPNINRGVFEDLKTAAKKNGTKYQVEVQPHMTGTDANALQIVKSGVLTGLLSIPLKYMHSTVETLAVSDVEDCGKLIADYVTCMGDGGLC